MLLIPLLLAPAVVAVATLVERRLGPSAAGWVAALPVSFSVAVLAVTLDGGPDTASALALSAASHVPAQVMFGLAFAAVLVRRGPLAGIAAGALVYAAGSLLIAGAPAWIAVVAAVPALAFAPRLMARGRPAAASRSRAATTAMTCAGASGIVAAAVLTSRLAGPELAGAVAAFPTISALLASAVVARDGRRAGAHALAGLVRSLPCYLAFTLAVAFTAPATGAAAIVVGLLACLAVAGATWRGVPVTPRPALQA